MYSNYIKRFTDIIVAITLIVILSPFLLVVSFLIVIGSKGPVFFMQERVGKKLRDFKIYKFRTMTNEEHVITNQPVVGRATGVTKIGFYLRRFKIDELPQLLNVLKGDLTLIGPRPSIKAHLSKMTKEEIKRYNVTPGLSGLAQVSGNIHLTWKRRYELDLEYIDNLNWLLDLKILFRTIMLIMVGETYFINKPLNVKNELTKKS